MSDAPEMFDLLVRQRDLMKRILAKLEPVVQEEVGTYLFLHGWNIYEASKATIILLNSQVPFTIPLLARSALESAFYIGSVAKNPSLGRELTAREKSEMARKTEHWIGRGIVHERHRSVPEASKAKAPDGELPKRPAQYFSTENIARLAGLTEFYEDEYRFLCLHVHGNQAGIFGSGDGILVRKAAYALSHSLVIASGVLRTGSEFGDEIQACDQRLGEIRRAAIRSK